MTSQGQKPLLHLVRPVVVCVVALGVIAFAMAIKGRHSVSLALGGVLVLISGILVWQVHTGLRHLHTRSVSLQQAACEAELHYVSVLRQIVTLSDSRDRYYEGHSARVGTLSRQLSARLGLDEQMCELMNWAGELHDIGMLAIPERILAQRGRVDGSAFATIKKHSHISYDMLRPLRSLAAVLPAIRDHHERMNGTGYPEGRSGQKICLGARIIAVTDAFDAMTHDRPHRTAISPQAAVAELRRCCPSGFDEECVRALAQQVGVAWPAAEDEPAAAARAAVA